MTGSIKTISGVLFLAIVAYGQPPVQSSDFPIDAATRQMVINQLSATLTANYFDVSLAANMSSSITAKAAAGGYDSITSALTLAQALTSDMRAISHDKHLFVASSAAALPSTPAGPSRQEADYFNENMTAVQRLPGNIGYLRLSSFDPAAFLKDRLTSAMNFLAGTDGLLIDLRDNPGGDSSGYTLLASYFLGPDPVDLNDTICDRGCPPSVGPAVGNVIHQTTVSDIGGTSYGAKPVYVLTSSGTFSAAEAFTYALQARGRAFVVGEVTGGGAHPTQFIQLNSHFQASIPYAHTVNPVTGTSWEGVGVQPDLAVSADLAQPAAQLAALWLTLDASTSLPGYARNDITKAIEQISSSLEQQAPGTSDLAQRRSRSRR